MTSVVKGSLRLNAIINYLIEVNGHFYVDCNIYLIYGCS